MSGKVVEPTEPLLSGYRGLVLRVKRYRGEECVELYLHSHLCLHVVHCDFLPCEYFDGTVP
jgi:hypothetical protein